MATKPVVKGNAFLWGGHRLSLFTMQATLPVSAEEVDSTVYEDKSLSAKAGLRDRSFEVTGCAGNEFEYDILAKLGQDGAYTKPLLFPCAGGVPAHGDLCAAQNAWLSAVPTLGGARGELAKFDLQLSAVGDILFGNIFVNTLAAPSATHTSAGFELGALGAGQAAFLCVQISDIPGIGGTTPVGTVILESDADDTFASATTRATVASISVPGGHLILIDGDTTPITDEWYRVRLTSTGTSPTFPLLVGAGIWNKPV